MQSRSKCLPRFCICLGLSITLLSGCHTGPDSDPSSDKRALETSEADCDERANRSHEEIPELVVSQQRVAPTIIQWQDRELDRSEPDSIYWHPVVTDGLFEFRISSASRHEIRGAILRLFRSVEGVEQKPISDDEGLTIASGIGDSNDFSLNSCKDGASVAVPSEMRYIAVNIFHNVVAQTPGGHLDDLVTTYFIEVIV